MEIELESRVKPLGFKVKAMSRETTSQKASCVLDSDLRTHWSTSTNTKEWILLELHEPCLLSHMRIYNKSVLEWEISVGLRYKPESFVKVRPRCEAPRRDIIYPMNYSPCRYVRISCLRGNPIAIFFIQLIGISVTGLEPEFQPVVNHLLPHIMSHKQDVDDTHLQLLQDITNRLLVFLPQIEEDLNCFPDDAAHKLQFLAMLVGPFYPILHIVNQREKARGSGNISDFEVNKNIQVSSSLTVSSNFEPRRSRNTAPFASSSSSSFVFRPDTIFLLLRKAYQESNLATVCRMASTVLHKLSQPLTVQEGNPSTEASPVFNETSKSELSDSVNLSDYSRLFGKDFQILDVYLDSQIVSFLDMETVEEGILHVLYACASQPQLCGRLAMSAADFWSSALPLIQALLPALRPSARIHCDQVDDKLSPWTQLFVRQALSQIVDTSSSSVYCPLLQACAGYLSSYSPSHAKTACVLIDLCTGVLAPWTAQVIAKIDLTIELLEELLSTIQSARHSPSRARAALNYVVLAVSGHMDAVLAKYKEVKHRVLFLMEMLEPFLDPALCAVKRKVSFRDLSFTFMDKEEQNCAIALNVISKAVQKAAILESLECEWRNGSATPSVILSILEPHMLFPPDVDVCKSSVSENLQHEASNISSLISGSALPYDGAPLQSNSVDECDGKTDVSDSTVKMEACEDISLFFAPPELQRMTLRSISNGPTKGNLVSKHKVVSLEKKKATVKDFSRLFQNDVEVDEGFAPDYFILQADYFQLVNFRECDLRASEFRHLALDLHSQHEHSAEAHHSAIDAMLLAAECYVNPLFMASFKANTRMMNLLRSSLTKTQEPYEMAKRRNISKKSTCNMETIALFEKKRDKLVIEFLVEAAELDQNYQKKMSDLEGAPNCFEEINDQAIQLSDVDVQHADAITMVRQSQALLCKFLIQRLKRGEQSMHEILMHCLVFFLHSATQIYCAPEEVIDIILASAEHLNGMLTSLYNQHNEGDTALDPEKCYVIRQRWILLQGLVIESSGSGEGSGFVTVRNAVRYHNLIPPAAWLQRISTFCISSSPLVRFLGWMAVSRNAKLYIKEQIFLVSDLSQLTSLLYIFMDDLAMMNNIVNQTCEDGNNDESEANTLIGQGFELADRQDGERSFGVVYPALSKIFPNMKIQFEAFGKIILEAVGLQLRSLTPSVIPDALRWFSDLCSWPFFQSKQSTDKTCPDNLKGHVGRNAKAIILYILEAIIVGHMEAIVPEIPRVVHVLISLCRTSYCDVSFLDSMMRLLKPLLSYSLHKESNVDNAIDDNLCLDFELLCFDELFIIIKEQKEKQDESAEKYCNRALAIFVLGNIFSDLSFPRRQEVLQSLTLWADFTAFEPTTSFHDYLCAFETVLESCKSLLTHTLRVLGFIPLQKPHSSDFGTDSLCNKSSGSSLCFLDDVFQNISSAKDLEKHASNGLYTVSLNQKSPSLDTEQIELLSKDLGSLITKLYPAIELCWNFHHQLSRKLTITSVQCFVYSQCLSSVAQKVKNVEESDKAEFPDHLRIGLEGLAEVITTLQENQRWEVASVMLDCLLGVPHWFPLYNISGICSAIKKFSCGAPKLSWRLLPNRWLSLLLTRGIHSLCQSDDPLIDLFHALLAHHEPEQRVIALQNLGILVGQDVNREILLDSACSKVVLPRITISDSEQVLSLLVSSTWDQVALLASSDSLPLRILAMSVLVNYIPYAQQNHLQSFLAAADGVLNGLGKLAHPTCEGPLVRLSLTLIAQACLYSPSEDVYLIPQNVWRIIETIGLSKSAGKHGDLEKKTCEVLCRLRIKGDDMKEVLKELLTSNHSQQLDSDFGSTREAILQVLAGLRSAESHYDIFSERFDQEMLELEEAKLELEIIQKESALQEPSKAPTNENQSSHSVAFIKDGSLQQIKDCIRSLEKSKLREDIIARRQKKLLLRRDRQKHMEEAAVQEAELLREFDRERTIELEKDIERLRLLEIERAKTRELRHNLDMEKERQTQRELQRELEQVESGIGQSRREFSSTHIRPRGERYRERESGRASSGASARTSGNLQSEISSSNSSTANAVLLNSRTFVGQPPTILQTRDHSDERGSEDNVDSGDTVTVGDADSFDGGQYGGFGSAPRHGGGSRGSISRQVIDRKERDPRHEGKWERKY